MVYILSCDLCVICQSAVPLLIPLCFASKEPGCFLEQWVQASRRSFKLFLWTLSALGAIRGAKTWHISA